MPEGDAIHKAARRLQALVGETVEADSPHPRAAVKRIAERLDGRRLEHVEAVGKNLLLRFDGGLVLRSHLRMRGRWAVRRRRERQGGACDADLQDPARPSAMTGRHEGGSRARHSGGRPWLVLRGSEHEAVQWNGPVLELSTDRIRRLGPDILAAPPDFERMLANLREAPQQLRLGEALLQQRRVAGVGNMWMAEALWEAKLSPWAPLAGLADNDIRAALAAAASLMRASLDSGRQPRRVYRRPGRPCSRCGTPIRSRGLGDANRTAYWCPVCQGGGPPSEA
jgi:endonuclease VIII